MHRVIYHRHLHVCRETYTYNLHLFLVVNGVVRSYLFCVLLLFVYHKTKHCFVGIQEIIFIKCLYLFVSVYKCKNLCLYVHTHTCTRYSLKRDIQQKIKIITKFSESGLFTSCLLVRFIVSSLFTFTSISKANGGFRFAYTNTIALGEVIISSSSESLLVYIT